MILRKGFGYSATQGFRRTEAAPEMLDRGTSTEPSLTYLTSAKSGYLAGAPYLGSAAGIVRCALVRKFDPGDTPPTAPTSLEEYSCSGAE
jgi:hypothetical protein